MLKTDNSAFTISECGIASKHATNSSTVGLAETAW